MSEKAMTVRLPAGLKEALDAYVEDNGLKVQTFVARAIADKLDELEDVRDSVAAIEADDWMTAQEFDEALGL